jgi:uncharacterized membrane protein
MKTTITSQISSLKEISLHIISIIIVEGILFLLFGVGIIFYPRLLDYFFVAIFMALGTSFLFLGFKLWTFFKKVEKVFEKFNNFVKEN